MKKNLIVVIGLLVLCAIAARYTQRQAQARQALAQEITRALELLWKTNGHHIEIIPDSAGARAKVRVVLPDKTGPQREQWNFALVGFIAQRHPHLKLTQIDLINAKSQKPLLPLERLPNASTRPYSGGTNDQIRAEIVRREAQSWLDDVMKSHRALALVECITTEVPMEIRPEVHYNLTAYANYNSRRASTYQQSKVTLIVVIDARAADAQSALVRLREMPRTPRILVLP